MNKNSTGSAVLKSLVLVILGAVIVLGLYLMFTRSRRVASEESYELTAVDEITTTNLDKAYPANPRKVIDLYARTMQVMYKETYTDDQLDKMIDVLAGIMDDELLANQYNFKQSIKNEVSERKEGDYSISVYRVQEKEPEVVTVDGKKMCDVECYFSLRKGTTSQQMIYQFVMRQDDAGKWKILGWTLRDED